MRDLILVFLIFFMIAVIIIASVALPLYLLFSHHFIAAGITLSVYFALIATTVCGGLNWLFKKT